MSVQRTQGSPVQQPKTRPAELQQNVPSVEKSAPVTAQVPVKAPVVQTGFTGVTSQEVHAPAASELNDGPSQAMQLAHQSRAERIQSVPKATRTSAELNTSRFMQALQNGASGAWSEAREPVTQAAMGTLKTLASTEGSEAVKAAVKAAAASKTALPMAKLVGETFVGSLKTVLSSSATAAAAETGKAVAAETGKAVAKEAVKETGKAIAKEAVKETGKAVAKEAAKETGKAIAKEAAKETGKAVAKEGVKSGVVGVAGSLPAIGNVINGAFALASGAEFLGSLADSKLSTGEKVGKFVKFGSAAVATLLPVGGGLLSFAGGVAGGAITGASSATKNAAPAPAAQTPAPSTERDAKLNDVLGAIHAPNALNPAGGTELAEGTLESPQQTAGVLNRLSTALLDGKAVDPGAANTLKEMASIVGSVTESAPLSAANKARLKTLADSVGLATDEGLKSITLRTAQELRKPEVAAKFGKHAVEAAKGALDGIASLQRMAGAKSTVSASSVSPEKVQARASQALQVLGKITHFAMEAKSKVE